MGITDYNSLRKMLGLTPVALQDNQYLIHMPNRVYQADCCPYRKITLNSDTDNQPFHLFRFDRHNISVSPVERYFHLSVFLHQNLRLFSDKDSNPAMAEGRKAAAYYDYDVYMGITDYNSLRKMLGLTPVALKM